MNTQFENQDNRATDMFRQLREMKSPLSMNAVKNYILEHIEEMTIWQKIQRLIFQTGAFIAVIGSICCINSPAGDTKGGTMIRSANEMTFMAITDKPEKQIRSEATHTIAVTKNVAGFSSIDRNTSNIPYVNRTSASSDEDAQQITLTPIPKVDPSFIDSKPSGLSELFIAKENQTSPIRPFAEMQGIAFSGHIRMYGEGVAAGVMHDWQILTLQIMNTNGVHDDRKDAPSLTNIKIKKENEQQFALMFGGIIERGRLFSSFQIGPSYGMSQITSGIREVPASNTILNQNIFGVSAQISVGYRVTDFLSANIEGLLNYHSGISGGIMMSIMIHP
jgi:hypothetical protein